MIANRYEVMASYGRGLKLACAAELAKLKAQGQEQSAQWAQFKAASRWLHRDEARIPQAVLTQIATLRAASPSLDKLVVMREELRQLWTRTNVSAEQLVLICRLGAAALRKAALQSCATSL